MTTHSFRSLTARAGGGLDAATVTWAAAVVTNGGTVSDPRKTVVDSLIVGLKADGLWTKLDRLWLLAAANTASALTDIVAASLATPVNAPTFTTDTGYNAGGSATVYVNSNFNPTVGTNNYVQDSATLFVWDATGGDNDTGAMLGTTNGASSGGDIFVSYAGAGGFDFIRVNDNPASGQISTVSTAGLYHGNRSGATAREAYRNGVSLGTYGSQASQAPLNNPFTICCWSGFGLASSHNCAAAGMGGSLNATEVGNLYTRLRTYMTAVGIP